MKSWSNLKINDSFRIYSSWAFWNTPNMSDLSDYSMRYSKFKYNQIFASDFSQRLSSCVLNMPSNENLKASICSLVTPLSSHVIKFIVHSIILIWQAMFSCPAWFWLYCILHFTYSWHHFPARYLTRPGRLSVNEWRTRKLLSTVRNKAICLVYHLYFNILKIKISSNNWTG